MIGRLAPDAVVAGRARREPDLRQRRQRGVALQQLARLPPGAVDDHQRDRTRRLRLREIDRVRPGKRRYVGPAAGQRRADLLRRRRSRRPRAARTPAGRGAPAAPSRSARAVRAGAAAARRASASAATPGARSSRPTRVAGSARRSRGGGRARESRRARLAGAPLNSPAVELFGAEPVSIFLSRRPTMNNGTGNHGGPAIRSGRRTRTQKSAPTSCARQPNARGRNRWGIPGGTPEQGRALSRSRRAARPMTSNAKAVARPKTATTDDKKKV